MFNLNLVFKKNLQCIIFLSCLAKKSEVRWFPLLMLSPRGILWNISFACQWKFRVLRKPLYSKLVFVLYFSSESSTEISLAETFYREDFRFIKTLLHAVSFVLLALGCFPISTSSLHISHLKVKRIALISVLSCVVA